MIETSPTCQFPLADPLAAELARKPDRERKIELFAQPCSAIRGGTCRTNGSPGPRIHLGCRDVARTFRHLDVPSPPGTQSRATWDG